MVVEKHNAVSFAQPVKARELLDQERREFDDCLSCRIVGKSCPTLALTLTLTLSLSPFTDVPLFLTDLTYICTGGTAFIGLAGYSYWEGMRQLENNRATILKSRSAKYIGMRGRRASLVATSLGLAWMGIYRLFG